MRTYETLFIVNPELEESEISNTIDTIQEIITTGSGKVIKVDRWGRRQLAYMIRNKREGYYVLIYFEGPSALIGELNRRYKLATGTIMRSLVVQLRKGQLEEILESGTYSPGTLISLSESEEEYEGEESVYPEEDEHLIGSTEG